MQLNGLSLAKWRRNTLRVRILTDMNVGNSRTERSSKSLTPELTCSHLSRTPM